MLVLSRKRDEEIIIETPDGQTISVLVTDIRVDKVRLGITAPSTYPINRREVHDAIQRDRKGVEPK